MRHLTLEFKTRCRKIAEFYERNSTITLVVNNGTFPGKWATGTSDERQQQQQINYGKPQDVILNLIISSMGKTHKRAQ